MENEIVYLATKHVMYEADHVLGVFYSEDKAKWFVDTILMNTSSNWVKKDGYWELEVSPRDVYYTVAPYEII